MRPSLAIPWRYFCMSVYVFITREPLPLLFPTPWAIGTLGVCSVLYSMVQQRMWCFPEVSMSCISHIFALAAMKYQVGKFGIVCSLPHTEKLKGLVKGLSFIPFNSQDQPSAIPPSIRPSICPPTIIFLTPYLLSAYYMLASLLHVGPCHWGGCNWVRGTCL